MKIIISESQHRRLFEEEQKVLHIPNIKVFGNDWSLLQKYLESKGNPPYSIGGNLKLWNTPIESLGNLISVEGNLLLRGSKIKSLGNLTSVGGVLDLSKSDIKSLGNLTSVGGELDLSTSDIKSLGNLSYVGGHLDLENTPISEKYSEKEIRQMVNIRGHIYKKL
jgi:hypothetical protein